jgi:sarcosine oxidase/L-pipecolate oxidase
MLRYAEDINKIVRMDYGDDVIYQNLATEALPIWRQWNEEAKEDGRAPVYNETGVLYFCRDGKFSEYERRSIQRVRAAGYGDAIEEFTTPDSIVERFPQFADSVANGFNVAYLNKYAGQLITKDVVHTVVQSENINNNANVNLAMLHSRVVSLFWCRGSCIQKMSSKRGNDPPSRYT